MRTLSAGLTTHVSGSVHQLAAMVRLDLEDGSTLAFTDHDQPLSVDLGDGAATYYPQTGMLPTDLTLSLGFEADEVEVSGPVVDSATQPWHVTRLAVLGGRFEGAIARYFYVNWSDLAQGPARLLRGYVYKSEVMGSEFKLTIQSEITKFRQDIGRLTSAYCATDFGSAECGLTPDTVAATILSVTDEREFTVSFSGSYADDYFNRGTVQFTSGDLNGTRKIEITDWSSAGSITLFEPLADVPQVGDTLTITQGCYDPATSSSKTRTACMSFSNIVNFRGFPDVPGTEQVLQYPNPS